MDKKERFTKQLAIAKRAIREGLCQFNATSMAMDIELVDDISMAMDIELADDIFNLRLDELLNADNFNFAHDICGIQNHIDRRNKVFTDCFVPRYAGVKPECKS